MKSSQFRGEEWRIDSLGFDLVVAPWPNADRALVSAVQGEVLPATRSYHNDENMRTRWSVLSLFGTKYEFLNIASFHPLHHHQLSSPSCCPSARGCACSAQCAAPINFDSKLVKCSNGYLHLNMLFLWQSVHIEHVCIMYAHKCAVHTQLTYQ